MSYPCIMKVKFGVEESVDRRWTLPRQISSVQYVAPKGQNRKLDLWVT